MARRSKAPCSSLAQEGGALFSELGCSGCHGIGSKVRAPQLEDFTASRCRLRTEHRHRRREDIFANSILLPRSQIAAGYDAVMPSFEGKVSEDQLLRLVVYIKSLAGRQP